MKNIQKSLNFFFRLSTSSTAKNTYFVFVGNFLTMFFSFLYTILLVRLLSLSDFGYFSALWSLWFITSDVADLGIGTSMPRFLPTMENDSRKLLSFFKAAFLSQFTIAIILLVMIFIFSHAISDTIFHNPGLSSLIKWISFGILFTILATFFGYSLSARQRFLHSSIVSSVGGLLRLLSVLILIVFLQISLKNVIHAQVIAFFILFFLSSKIFGWKFIKSKIQKDDFKKLYSFSSYLGIARGLTSLSGKLDVLMLIALTNSIETGIYATASRVTAIYPLLSGSFSTVIAPKIALYSDKKHIKSFMLKVILVTIVLILSIIFLILISRPFLITLFGVKVESAVPIFRLLLISMIFFVASIPSVSIALYYLKKPQILTANSIIQLLIVFFGNLYFIPRFGKYGACYSMIIAFGITLIITSYFSYYYYRKS